MERSRFLDRIRGSLIGGAIGDALGYPVEFMMWEEIQRGYGVGGIQCYDLKFGGGSAIFSDDTQMSLFTANGILLYETRRRLGDDRGTVSDYVHRAYREWLKTQSWRGFDLNSEHLCWLYEIRGLHHDRAPGGTCLSALRSGRMGTIEAPLNRSKGCGGVMRVAPLGLRFEPKNEAEQRRLDRESADIAAITHGHPLGYIPAAILTHIVGVGVYGDGSLSLKGAVDEAWTSVKDQFKDVVPSNYLAEMEELLVRAKTLAEAPGDDEEHVEAIGKGWTGDEALAIAVYCALRYPTDFSKAVVAAVNHGGDSDSTGAIVGNILGAWLGYDAIEEKWKENLELKDVLLETADDLCFGALPSEGETSNLDETWRSKYCQGHAGDKYKL